VEAPPFSYSILPELNGEGAQEIVATKKFIRLSIGDEDMFYRKRKKGQRRNISIPLGA